MRGKQQLEKTLQTIVVLLVLCCTGFGLSESGSVVESSMCVCVCCKTAHTLAVVAPQMVEVKKSGE